MEENTFEIFEGELGVQLKEPPPKPSRQLRRADAQSSKRKKEAPPSPRKVSKEVPKELSKPISLCPVVSSQNLSDDENPWEGITLNRCLLLAVIIIVVSSAVNSVNESLWAFWETEEGEDSTEDLALKSIDLKLDNSPEQTESFLWNSLFWWSWGSTDENAADDTDDDGEGASGRRSRKKTAREKGTHEDPGSVKHREKPGKQLLKEKEEITTGGRRDKERRGRHEEEEEEEVKDRGRGKREKETGMREKHDDDNEEEEERPVKKRQKEEIQKREHRQG